MTDKNLAENNTEMSMGQLLQEYSYERPKRGDFIDAEVMQIDENHILLDLGAKTDAIITPNELKNTDEKFLEDLKEGDIVPVYVMRPPTMLRKPKVSLQRGMEKADWDRANQLEENKELIKLEVTGKNKGGLLIKFGHLEGFLPASLMPTVSRAPGRRAAEQVKSNLIGEDIYLYVIQANPRRKKLIFSAREDQNRIVEKRMSELHEGDVVNGIVANLVEYGAFIDLLGVDGLLHISELEWDRTEHPSEILELGEKIEVKILEIDEENERISLSRKALLNPIEDLALEPELENSN